MNAKDTCRRAEENHPNRRRSYKNEHLDRQQQEDRQDVGRRLPAGAAVTSAKAFSWGNNSYGQLGNGTYGPATATNTPGAVSNLSDVRSVKDGCSHSLARFGDSTVWAWGYNGLGQLGNGTSGVGTDSDVPVAVKNLTGVTNMDGGYEFTVAVTQ